MPRADINPIASTLLTRDCSDRTRLIEPIPRSPATVSGGGCSSAGACACPPSSLTAASFTAKSSPLARHRGRDRSGLEPLSTAGEALVDHAPDKLAAPQNESRRDAVYDDVSIIDAEVEQGFAAVVVADKNRRQLPSRAELEPRV